VDSWRSASSPLLEMPRTRALTSVAARDSECRDAASQTSSSPLDQPAVAFQPAHNDGLVTMSSPTTRGSRRTKARRRKNEVQRGTDIEVSLEPTNKGGAETFLKIPPSRAVAATRLGRLSVAEYAQLQNWVRSRTSPYRVVVRSRIVLLAHRGLTVIASAAQLHVAPATVRLWRRRFEHGGLGALTTEKAGRGRPSGISASIAVSVLEAMRVLETDMRSMRRVAARAGTSASSVCRIWKRYGLGRASARDAIDDALRKIISGTPTDVP
jgi:transposase